MKSPTPSDDLPPRAGPIRRRAIALALPLCLTLSSLTLSSCFTLGLWGFDYTSTDGNSSWEFDETSWEGANCIPWYTRLLLTPFTLAADVATICIQYWLFADDDDGDAGVRRRRKGC